MSAEDAVELRKQWVKVLDGALQADGWGQIVEALDGYERLQRLISNSVDDLRPDAKLRASLNKTVLCLQMRSKALQAVSEADAKAGPSFEQMQELSPFLRALFTDAELRFPISVTRLDAVGGVRLATGGAGGKEEEGDDRGGTLLPQPDLVAGEQYVSIEIERWGLKDADTYVDPFVTVCVYDEDGKAMEAPQDTPICSGKAERQVLFGETVYIQTTRRKMRRANAGIFFEFKHVKPKKGNYVSTRCWAFMEMDELREGKIQLESYKKPTDPKRKKIKLFTVKELFLSLRVTLHSL